ncbi:hypothetical protein J4230_00120 [Candidatus Woesearchaeota archaeon]|nr:hypothetical protein [Candidatus Woesearchaeota archaeon]
MSRKLLVDVENLDDLKFLYLELVVRPKVGVGPLAMQLADGLRDVFELYELNKDNIRECANYVDGVSTEDIYFWPLVRPLVYYIGEPFSRSVRGSLNAGNGRVLVHLLKNTDVSFSREDLVKISGSWSIGSVVSSMGILAKQVRHSRYYSIDRVEGSYTMKIIN